MKFIFKLTRKLFSNRSRGKISSRLLTKFTFWGNGVKYSSFSTTGHPYVNVKRVGIYS